MRQTVSFPWLNEEVAKEMGEKGMEARSYMIGGSLADKYIICTINLSECSERKP